MKQSNVPRVNTTYRFVAYIAFAIVPLMLNACSSKGSDTAVSADSTPTELAAVAPQTPGRATELGTAPQTAGRATGSSSDSTVPAPAASSSSATTIKTATVKAAAVPTPTAARSNPDVDANTIPKLNNEVGALADVTVKSCVKASGRSDSEWKSAGTVTNSTKSAASYVITTAFLDAQGTTVGLGFSQVNRVKAGSSRDWVVAALTTVSEGLQCIMRVTRGDA